MAENYNPSVVWQQVIRGGLVNNADTARKIAEIFIVDLYGAGELTRQEPLKVSDGGETWVIEGSYNSDRRTEGVGAVRIVLEKKDCQVKEAYRAEIIHPPPAVQKIINDELKKRQGN